jgi:hypothetical protein
LLAVPSPQVLSASVNCVPAAVELVEPFRSVV